MTPPRTDEGAAPERTSDGSVRARLAEVARQKPVAPRLRNVIWILCGGAVLVIAILQVLGLSANPVARRVRETVEERERGKATKTAPGEAAEPTEPTAPAPATPPSIDESVPFPAGLPADVVASLRVAFAVAKDPDAELAGRAIRGLPALAEKAPEDRRREVRTFVLKRLSPLVGSSGPLAMDALAAANEILKSDPEAAPK